MSKPQAAPRRDVLSDITQTILTKLEAGTLPWRRPWKDGKRPTNAAQPHNAVTGRPYSGLNNLLLGIDSATRGSAGYLTFQQAKAAGGHIRKGAKGIPVVLWKPMQREKQNEATGEAEQHAYLMLRTFTVFSLDDAEDLPAKRVKRVDVEAPAGEPTDALGPCSVLLANLQTVPVEHGGNRACYSPSIDAIRMPTPEQFTSIDSYRATLAHETVHATGHPSRLAREFGKRFGDDAYAFEELVAELGAAFVGARVGLDTSLLEEHASYLDHWLKVLKQDKRAIMTAAAAAQRAVDLLCPLREDEDQGNEEHAERATAEQNNAEDEQGAPHAVPAAQAEEVAA